MPRLICFKLFEESILFTLVILSAAKNLAEIPAYAWFFATLKMTAPARHFATHAGGGNLCRDPRTDR